MRNRSYALAAKRQEQRQGAKTDKRNSPKLLYRILYQPFARAVAHSKRADSLSTLTWDADAKKDHVARKALRYVPR